MWAPSFFNDCLYCEATSGSADGLSGETGTLIFLNENAEDLLNSQRNLEFRVLGQCLNRWHLLVWIPTPSPQGRAGKIPCNAMQKFKVR